MNRILFSIFIICIFIASCAQREEGPIGEATITGKVYALDYNNSFTKKNDEYYVAKEDVYIIYGDDEVYGDEMETHYDGTYEFKNLAIGTYSVYAYTEDTTMQTTNLLPVIKTIEITEKDEIVEVDDITIVK